MKRFVAAGVWTAAALFGAACRSEPETLRDDVWHATWPDTGAQTDSETSTDDGDSAARDSASDSVVADAAIARPTPAAFRWMAKLVAADDGVEGILDTFIATGSGQVTVRLRPTVSAMSLVSLGTDIGDAPGLRALRFGDAPFTDWLARRTEPVGWNYVATIDAVVEVRKGAIRRAMARHVRSSATRQVEVWNLDTGVGRLQAAEVRPGGDGGYELVQVSCSSWFPAHKKKPGACESTNRIYFVRNDTWWWDEARGTSCSPRDNGWCYPASPLPPASEFPPVR